MSDGQGLARLAYSVQECAKVLSVSPQFVRLEIARRRMRAARLGRRVVIPANELDRYLRAGMDPRDGN